MAARGMRLIRRIFLDIGDPFQNSKAPPSPEQPRE